MTLPNFLGIGAQRAGTTWLHAQMRSHPEVYLPRRRKELHFFDRYYERGLEWYETCFPRADQSPGVRWMGEITPMYLYDPRVPRRIKEHLPDCRFLAILRNPADRAYSQYAHHVQNKGEERNFRDFLAAEEDVFGRGLYYLQLRRYMDLFPGENFLVLIFEEVMKDPAGALGELANFLGIQPGGFDSNLVGRKVNPSYRSRFGKVGSVVRNWGEFLRRSDLDWVINAAKALGLRGIFGNAGELPRMSPEVRRELLERYDADMAALEGLLRKDLSVWRNPVSQDRGR